MKVIDLQNIIDGRFEFVHKSVGVLLHDSGFMRYRKLTPENYYYWWYEVDDPNSKICPCCNNEIKNVNKLFTYQWADMERTRKFEWLEKLVKYHKDTENLHRLLNNALNIIAAIYDGINLETGKEAWVEVFDMYYSNRKTYNKQLTLF